VWQALEVATRALMRARPAVDDVPAETSPCTDGTADASTDGARVPAVAPTP
jgi:hypothetical protein